MTERTFAAFTEADLLAGTRFCAANARTHSDCADRFLICTKPFNPRRTVLYTIVDLKKGIHGTAGSGKAKT
ncbi:hypothetical protein [Fibrella aestuarina]|uniref:hypothetical protein n=1 Tax=Fibrella aestuarina TaxID=651143 RepID=UPI0011D2B342|nr:hypothetical protein [Fibrella aestuarina]